MVLAVFLGGGVIASAFLGLPTAIVSRAISRRPRKPRKEAIYAVAAPLAVGLVMAWSTFQDVSRLSYISLFVEPQLSDYAAPVAAGLVALMNLAVVVWNVISLRRMRAKP